MDARQRDDPVDCADDPRWRPWTVDVGEEAIAETRLRQQPHIADQWLLRLICNRLQVATRLAQLRFVAR